MVGGVGPKSFFSQLQAALKVLVWDSHRVLVSFFRLERLTPLQHRSDKKLDAIAKYRVNQRSSPQQYSGLCTLHGTPIRGSHCIDFV